jgi:hypothetical protein
MLIRPLRGLMPTAHVSYFPAMLPDIRAYNAALASREQDVCDVLAETIDTHLKGRTKSVIVENKIWHRHPVWFLDGNPVVGYSKQKPGIRLMFWSGKDFEEPGLNIPGGKFKDASVFFNDPGEVDEKLLKRWLKKAATIQWDYKNIVKRKGLLKLK